MNLIKSIDVLESFGFKKLDKEEILFTINGGKGCMCKAGYDPCFFGSPCIGNCVELNKK